MSPHAYRPIMRYQQCMSRTSASNHKFLHSTHTLYNTKNSSATTHARTHRLTNIHKLTNSTISSSQTSKYTKTAPYHLKVRTQLQYHLTTYTTTVHVTRAIRCYVRGASDALLQLQAKPLVINMCYKTSHSQILHCYQFLYLHSNSTKVFICC